MGKKHKVGAGHFVKGFTTPGRCPIEMHHQTLHVVHMVEELVAGVEADSILLLQRQEQNISNCLVF